MRKEDQEVGLQSVTQRSTGPGFALSAKCGLQVLICSLSLSIRLRISQCETASSAKCLAESLPDPRCKLGALIRDDVIGEPMEPENVEG